MEPKPSTLKLHLFKEQVMAHKPLTQKPHLFKELVMVLKL
jgi:hypothetical protein